MKISRIVIQKYKNLRACTVDFAGNAGLAVVAGLNGSGKSNFLEALSLMMLDLRRGQRPSGVDWPLYELHYEIDGVSYQVRRTTNDQDGAEWIGLDEAHSEPVVPNRVIAMYSGEFNRLSSCGYVGTMGYQETSGMLLVTKEHLDVAVLTLALSNSEKFSSMVVNALLFGATVSLSYSAERPKMGEYGLESEAEDILLALSERSEREDGSCEIPLSELRSLFEEVGATAPGDIYTVLDQMLGGGGLSNVTMHFRSSAGDGLTVGDMSEGEKRLVLLLFIYEVLSDSRSLVLLDEPDAHVHETRKLDCFKLIEERGSAGGAFTVMTTHSPALIEHIRSEHLVVFSPELNGIVIRTGADVDAVAVLTDSRISYFSQRPIILFEGKSDVKILRDAISALRRLIPGKYGKLTLDRDFDYYYLGGADYAYDQIRLFRGKFPCRQMEVVLDNDKEGRKAFASVLREYQIGKQNPMQTVEQLDVHTRIHLLPSPTTSPDEYGIEDYFDKTYLDSRIRSYLSNPKYVSFMSMPSLKYDLKRELAGTLPGPRPPDVEYNGFQPLVDYLVSLR